MSTFSRKSLQIRGGISCETGPWSWTPNGCNPPCIEMYLSMLHFQGNVFNVQNWLKDYELYTIPVDNLTRTWQGPWIKRFIPTMSSGDLPISKWLKKREKYSRQWYLWTLCRSVVPWRCTTRFRPAVRLCQLEMVPRCFPIPCPRQDSEGEKSRPLDHMRQIPFVGTLKWDSAMYIYDNVVILSSMWYVFRFDHAHGVKRYNDRRMTRGQ